MKHTEQYADPALADRFKSWLDEAAPPAAPERLVYAVMDEVEAQAPRARLLPGIRLETVLQYVALTIVVAIGVAGGIFLTRSDSSGVATPSPRPAASSPVPASPTAVSPSIGALPSLATIDRFVMPPKPGPSAIRVMGSSLWVGTPTGEVVELDVATGTERSRTTVGVEAITITPVDGILWIGSGGPDLIWLDPTSHEVGTIRGAGGHTVVVAAGSLWVSRQEAFARIDPTRREVVGSIAVPGHRASDPAIVVGDELWTGAGPAMIRLALPGGAGRGDIAAFPSALVTVPRGTVAIDRGRLVQLSDASGILTAPPVLIDGLPDSSGEATVGNQLWVVGMMSGGPGEVVQIDLDTIRIVSRTSLGAGPRAIAVTGSSVWVGLDNGTLVRLRATP
jgi:hypothetical protein